MTKLHEAAQMALDALNKCIGRHYDLAEDASIGDAIEALRSALAQQGEPVAWYLPQGTDDSWFRDHRTVVACTGNKWEGWVPLYAGAAPAAQPDARERQLRELLELTAKENQQLTEKVANLEHALRFKAAIDRVNAELAHGMGADK